MANKAIKALKTRLRQRYVRRFGDRIAAAAEHGKKQAAKSGDYPPHGIIGSAWMTTPSDVVRARLESHSYSKKVRRGFNRNPESRVGHAAERLKKRKVPLGPGGEHIRAAAASYMHAQGRAYDNRHGGTLHQAGNRIGKIPIRNADTYSKMWATRKKKYGKTGSRKKR